MAGPEALGKDRYIEVIHTNSAQLIQAAHRGLEEPVPSCPGWYMATLVAHIGEVQRSWAHQITQRGQEMQELPDEAFASCPGLQEWYTPVWKENRTDLDHIPDCLIAWSEAATRVLIDAFRGIAPEEQVWHWSGDNRAITHMRNQAMEATVHRWDAQNAHHATTPISRDVAVDGISQHFEVQIPAARKWGKPIDGSGETYHFHATDGEGEWLVRFDGGNVTVTREHAKGDIAVQGSAEDIFLWLWGRAPADRLTTHGDASLLDRYRQLVPTSE